MPAGDLVVSDYQLELRTTLMGYGSSYPIDHERMNSYTPLGDQAYKNQDVELKHGDGSYGGSDRLGPLAFTFPLYFQGTASTAASAIQTMRTTWAPSTSDLPLYHQIPGVGKFYVNGRPRGVQVDARDLEFGRVLFVAFFVALDPTITEV